MDEKAVVIKNHLLKGMPGREISFRHSGVGDLYKFRIEGEPTHWLYLNYELVSDSEPVILVNLINIYRVVELLSGAEMSKWIYLSSEGLREVDEYFAKR